MLILSDNVQRNLVILANTLWPIKLIGILILSNNPLGGGGVLPCKSKRLTRIVPLDGVAFKRLD